MTTDQAGAKPNPFPPIQGPRDYPEDVPYEERPAPGARFFWPLSVSQFDALRQRFRENDRARLMTMGSREIALDMALIERFGMTGSPAYALMRECYDACCARERTKYGASATPALAVAA